MIGRKSMALYLVVLLLTSSLCSTVVVGETVDGGVANVSQVRNAPAVLVPDVTVEPSGGDIEVAYDVTGEVEPSDLEIRLMGSSDTPMATETDVSDAQGTVTFTLPDTGTVGDYRIEAELVNTAASWENPQERVPARNDAIVSVQSPSVEIADYSIANTASGNDEVYAGEEFTVDVTIDNDANTERSVALNAYVGSVVSSSGQKTASVAGNTEKIVTLSAEAPSSSWLGDSDEITLPFTVNDEPETNLVVKRPPTVSASITDIAVTANSGLYPNQEIYFTATVENDENTLGTATVDLTVDGQTENSKSVSLPAGESGTVTFSRTFTSVGDHTVTIGEKTKTVTIAEPIAEVTNVEHVGGTAPSEEVTTDHVRVEPPATESQLLEISITDGFNEDLSGLGIDESSEFEFTLELQKSYSPDILVASAQDVSWTVEEKPTHYLITMTASPLDTHYHFEESGSPEEWPGNLAATYANTPELSLAIDEIPDDSWSPLSGMILATDSQSFSAPMYVPPGPNSEGRLTYDVAGPHFLLDGETVNDGYYEAFVPDSVLTAWGVSSPSDLEASYQNEDLDFDAETVENGIQITATYHYSSGTVEISPKDESSDTGRNSNNDGSRSNRVNDGGSATTTTEEESDATTTSEAPETTVAGVETTTTTTETTASPTKTTTESTGTATDETSVPGFGVSAALVALVAAALLAVRREG